MVNRKGSRFCPGCGGRIWRLPEDKFLKCHRCGWIVSYPILRWLTNPSWVKFYLHQLRSSPISTLWSLTKVASVVLIVAVLVTGAVPMSTISEVVGSGPTGELSPGSSSEEAPEDRGITQEGYNLNHTESMFIEYLNRERSSRGLQNVSKRSVLTEMGREHSQDMAEKEYFAHVEPDGDTIKDRYEQRGLLPECELPIGGSDRYYAGAENIAQPHVNSRLRVDWAEGGTYSVYDEQDVAWAVFQMWMHSEPHRKAMLVSSADEAGLGIYITDSDEAYVSLELC